MVDDAGRVEFLTEREAEAISWDGIHMQGQPRFGGGSAAAARGGEVGWAVGRWTDIARLLDLDAHRPRPACHCVLRRPHYVPHTTRQHIP